MAQQIQGDTQVEIGFGLPQHTNVSRLAYTPAQSGYEVYDTDDDTIWYWDGTDWRDDTNRVIDNNANHTTAFVENNTIVYVNNAADVTVTVNNLLPIGGTITYIQRGAGQIIFSAGGGVTINAFNSADRTEAQYASATLTKRASNEFYLLGQIV